MKTRIFLGRIMSVILWLPVVVYLRFGSRTRILIESKGKILLVKGTLGNGKWSLPGGGLKRGEEPIAGVIRETKEETGIELNPNSIKYLGLIRYRENFANFKCERFKAKISDQATPRIKGFEIIDAAWVDPKTLNETNTNKEVLDMLTV